MILFIFSQLISIICLDENQKFNYWFRKNIRKINLKASIFSVKSWKMNVSASIGIIKNATTKNASLKYVLRTIPDVSILLGKRKQDILNRIDEE